MVTHRSSFLTSVSKFNVDANDEIFDVDPENDRASPNVKTPFVLNNVRTLPCNVSGKQRSNFPKPNVLENSFALKPQFRSVPNSLKMSLPALHEQKPCPLSKQFPNFVRQHDLYFK